MSVGALRCYQSLVDVRVLRTEVSLATIWRFCLSTTPCSPRNVLTTERDGIGRPSIFESSELDAAKSMRWEVSDCGYPLPMVSNNPRRFEAWRGKRNGGLGAELSLTAASRYVAWDSRRLPHIPGL